MDESDARGEPVVTATGGVTLQKRLVTEEFTQPTVLYELESQRDTAVDVRIIEPIPPALEPDDIGFLGAPDEQLWAINGPKLVLERTLEAGGACRTGVAARGDRAEAISELLETPEFVDVDEADDTRRVDGGPEPAEAAPSAPAEAGGALVERLVAELRDGAVPAETVAALRAELGATPGERPSLEARMAQLQADVADVRAYSNAMEGFLDEHGSPDAVVDQLQARLDDMEGRLEAVESDVAARTEDVTAVEARVAELEAGMDALEGTVESVEERLPGPNVGERLEALEADLAEVSEFTTSLKAAFRQ